MGFLRVFWVLREHFTRNPFLRSCILVIYFFPSLLTHRIGISTWIRFTITAQAQLLALTEVLTWTSCVSPSWLLIHRRRSVTVVANGYSECRFVLSADTHLNTHHTVFSYNSVSCVIITPRRLERI